MKPTHKQPASNPEEIAERRFHATRCAWHTSGRTCLLTGTLSTEVGGTLGNDGIVRGPKAFCAFHYDAMQAGHGASDSREFEAWLDAYQQQFPAKVYGHSQFTRFPADVLWRALCGHERTPSLDKPEARSFRPASAEERRAAFARVSSLTAPMKTP